MVVLSLGYRYSLSRLPLLVLSSPSAAKCLRLVPILRSPPLPSSCNFLKNFADLAYSLLPLAFPLTPPATCYV